MISGISGTVKKFGPSTVHVDTGGVEYEVHVPLSVFEKLQMEPEPRIYLHVYHHFYQDGQRLFGFLEAGQRELFSALLTLKGLGSALALSLLSHLDGPSLLQICEVGDVKSLTRIPRVGKSTAETIVFEIGRKKEKWRQLLAVTGTQPARGAESSEEGLALEALLQLGYKENQARSVLDKVRKEKPEMAGASELIKECLGLL